MTSPTPEPAAAGHVHPYPVADDDPARVTLATAMGAPPRRRRTPFILAAVAVLAAGAGIVGTYALMAGRATAPASPSSTRSAAPGRTAVSTSGHLTISGSGVLNLDDVNCTGMRGYDDIRQGTQVVITDEAGTVIATGSLAPGQLVGSGATRKCVFGFFANGIPPGKRFYGVTISHRGTIQYSEADLSRGLELSLGD